MYVVLTIDSQRENVDGNVKVIIKMQEDVGLFM